MIVAPLKHNVFLKKKKGTNVQLIIDYFAGVFSPPESDKQKSAGSFCCHGVGLGISAGIAFSKYFALKWRHGIQALHFVLPLTKFGSCT